MEWQNINGPDWTAIYQKTNQGYVIVYITLNTGANRTCYIDYTELAQMSLTQAINLYAHS